MISFTLFLPSSLFAGKKAKSRYITLLYPNRELLKDFNGQIPLGRKLRFNQRKNILTVEDEVLAKQDTIVEKAELVLDMFPEKLCIDLAIGNFE